MPKLPFLQKATSWLMRKLGELVIWAVCVVLFSLFPIYVLYFNKQLNGALSVPVKELVVRGELLLVAAALGADSISRLLSRIVAKSVRAAPYRFVQVLLLLASISFVVAAASDYATLNYAIEQGRAASAEVVFHQSKLLFLATLLIGAGVILSD